MVGIYFECSQCGDTDKQPFCSYMDTMVDISKLSLPKGWIGFKLTDPEHIGETTFVCGRECARKLLLGGLSRVIRLPLPRYLRNRVSWKGSERLQYIRVAVSHQEENGKWKN